jgi:hypothetical protein
VERCSRCRSSRVGVSQKGTKGGGGGRSEVVVSGLKGQESQ